jgi:LCP family protein required for cell wall assembly
VLIGGEPGPWGPTIEGGRRHRVLRRLGSALGIVALAVAAAIATTGYLLYQQADSNLNRVALDQLETPTNPSDARHFLLVGSDARDGLTDEERRELTLGAFDGQRSDTMIYVNVSEDRSQVSLISLPRDLVVQDEFGRIGKLTDRFAYGPDAVIESLSTNYGLPVNHFAEVSLGGFTEVVRTLGGVTIELDEPLVDPKSGAEFTEPGEIEMSPSEALAYVRSRRGMQGDYQRMDRQQTFLRAVLNELTDARVLSNPAQLFRLVDDLSSNVTTDEALGLAEMRFLADDLRRVVAGGVPMATFPSYAQRVGVRDFVLPYEPGAAALADAISSGEPLPERATRAEAEDVVVAVWSGGRGSAGTIVVPTLAYAGFVNSGGAGAGPSDLDAGETTIVYELPDHAQQAAWVAALLGADLEPLPGTATPPPGAEVVVAVGDDAAGEDRR